MQTLTRTEKAASITGSMFKKLPNECCCCCCCCRRRCSILFVVPFSHSAVLLTHQWVLCCGFWHRAFSLTITQSDSLTHSPTYSPTHPYSLTLTHPPTFTHSIKLTFFHSLFITHSHTFPYHARFILLVMLCDDMITHSHPHSLSHTCFSLSPTFFFPYRFRFILLVMLCDDMIKNPAPFLEGPAELPKRCEWKEK